MIIQLHYVYAAFLNLTKQLVYYSRLLLFCYHYLEQTENTITGGTKLKPCEWQNETEDTEKKISAVLKLAATTGFSVSH